MTLAIGLILSTITLGIAGLHFYWAVGGKWGLSLVIPTTADGDALFKVGWASCCVVGVLMLGVSLYYLSWLTILPFTFPSMLGKYGLLMIGVVFFIRAVGDFKYAGFFKKERNTTFGRLDSKYFSPLCMLLALGSLLLHYLTH